MDEVWFFKAWHCNLETFICLSSWLCCCGVTSLLFLLILGVFLRTGDLQLMRKEERLIRWLGQSLVTCRLIRISGFGTAGSAISSSHLDATIAQFVSFVDGKSFNFFVLPS